MNRYITILFLAFLMISCNEKEITLNLTIDADVPILEELQDATIYEINIRQFTPEGTFKALEKRLPEIQKLGVEVLWLMPIQEIGLKNRKGARGSYYSIKDYTKINPEFGSDEDLASLIEKIHHYGMKVILDWVGNHTAWDHRWMDDHDDFYSRDSLGNMHPPVPDWSDVVDLNYDNKEMRDSMISDMVFWVEEFDFDGFRCDVAGMVPLDFWQDAISTLRSKKDVFMLAEAEEEHLHDEAFDMSYGWSLHGMMNEVAEGKKQPKEIVAFLKNQLSPEGNNMFRMIFTSNHDENTWKANAIDRLGSHYENMIALSFTIPGMPLIYGGQEAGLSKSLAFFEKDTIEWKMSPYFETFQKFVQLKKDHEVLSSKYLDNITFITMDNESLIAYTRDDQEGNPSMLVVLNMGDEEVHISLSEGLSKIQFNSWKTHETIDSKQIVIPAFDYLIATK